jgi:undecaprenyl-diphosphatase
MAERQRVLNDPPRRVAALCLALAGPALVVLALAVRGGPTALDILDSLLVTMRAGPFDALLDVVDVAGSLPVWALAVGLVAAMLARAEARLGAEAVVLAVAAEAVVAAIKALAGRARPHGAELADLVTTATFPSGHVTRAAVLAGIVIALVPWAARRPRLAIPLAVASVALMGVARVSSGAHFTSDVIGACLLAAGILASWAWVSPVLAGRRWVSASAVRPGVGPSPRR